VDGRDNLEAGRREQSPEDEWTWWKEWRGRRGEKEVAILLHVTIHSGPFSQRQRRREESDFREEGRETGNNERKRGKKTAGHQKIILVELILCMELWCSRQNRTRTREPEMEDEENIWQHLRRESRKDGRTDREDRVTHGVREDEMSFSGSATDSDCTHHPSLVRDTSHPFLWGCDTRFSLRIHDSRRRTDLITGFVIEATNSGLVKEFNIDAFVPRQ
jgi:hypothetical protein